MNKIRKRLGWIKERLYHSDELSRAFFLCEDDPLLLRKINEQDESALFQFSMIHMADVVAKISRESIYSGIEKEVMQSFLPVYFQNIKRLAEELSTRKVVEENELWSLLSHGLTKGLRNHSRAIIDLKFDGWQDYSFTARDMLFLNSMNEFLTLLESQIVSTASSDLGKIEQQVADPLSPTNEYEYNVRTNFFTDESGDPAFFVDLHIWADRPDEFLCNPSDFHEGSLFPLDHRCCYLMHQVLCHSDLSFSILKIIAIQTEFTTRDQSYITFDQGEWHSPYPA